MESPAQVTERRTHEPTARLTVVVAKAPVVAAGHAIALGAAASAAIDAPPSLAWAPRAGDEDEWSFVGWGTAARVHGSGEDRWLDLRTRADRLFERLDRTAALPFPPRLFGGFAFDPSESNLFAEARPLAEPRPLSDTHPRAEARPLSEAHPLAEAHSAPHQLTSAWSAFGDASFALPRILYARAGDRAFLAAFVPEAEASAAARALDELRRALETASHPPDFAPASDAVVGPAGAPAWHALITRALAEIDRRSFAKVVLCRTRHLGFSRAPDAARAFAFLDARHGECARFFVRRDRSVFLGATPERLLFVRDLRVVTEALAGSIARQQPGDDMAARVQLLASDKDRAEHAFVVDAIRAALAPSCAALTIPEAPQVRSLSHLHHLATPIAGTLAEPAHVLDLARRLHPTPALCGSPRDAARAFILANEPAPRGWYGGGVGWFDSRGDGAIAVAIRSALVTPRDAWIYAGAGIVRGSDPERELLETAVKERTMRDALGVPA